jgi:hypothetical protein
VDDGELVLKQGETCELKLWVLNSGTSPVKELWVVTGDEQEVWLGVEKEDVTSTFSPGLCGPQAKQSNSVVEDRNIKVK